MIIIAVSISTISRAIHVHDDTQQSDIIFEVDECARS